MISINLLPKKFVPKKRNFIPHMAIVALAALLFLWFGNSLATTYSALGDSQEELRRLREDLAKVEDAVKQVKQLEQDKLLLSQKEQAVAQITTGRTVWSHELYVLAGLVPNDIWLEQVSMSSRRRPVTVMVPNSRRGQPPVEKTVIQAFPAIRFTGYALSPRREKGVELVGEFIRNMKDDETFSRRFISPEMLSINRNEYEEQTVMKFVVDCEIEN
jgi:hypothetical protein